MEILDYMQGNGHEQLLVCQEASAGLRAFIAIHDTTLGPACGGVRMWPHASEEEGLKDVLRLAKAMTYKSAVAGLSLGGGKALILADPRKDKNEALLRAFGRFVDTLGGKYLTTEDVGMTLADLEHIAQETDHVLGLPLSKGGSGDTSELTGLGLYLGMKASAKAVWGSDSLEGRVVAIQGFGHVGTQLAIHLQKEQAKLVVTDIHEEELERARATGATVVKPDAIYDTECDIFSPCALGGVLNGRTIGSLKCSIIAGGANNQLLDKKDGEEIHKKGILYAPDYVINAGGIINVSAEMGGEYRPQWALEMVRRIYETTERVIHISREEDIPTSIAADRLAESHLIRSRDAKNITDN